MATDNEKTRVLPRRAAKGKEQAGGPQEAARGARKITFYCPNGHRVVADAALAGKRGHCSTCREPVTIPDASQPPPPPVESAAGRTAHNAVTDQPAAIGPPPSGGPSPPPPSAVADPEAGEQEPTWDFIAERAGPSSGEALSVAGWSAPGADFGGGEENPTAMLVARLWAERDRGGTIELHLAGGSVILPEWYDHAWSRGTHGLFASQAADGSVTLTAVAWETVQKVVVRQLAAVPDDMFT